MIYQEAIYDFTGPMPELALSPFYCRNKFSPNTLLAVIPLEDSSLIHGTKKILEHKHIKFLQNYLKFSTQNRVGLLLILQVTSTVLNWGKLQQLYVLIKDSMARLNGVDFLSDLKGSC